MTKARAAVQFQTGMDPVLSDVAVREPIGDEMLIRIGAVGICHTDITVSAQWPSDRLPMVFGHEGAGTVTAIGPDASVAVGQKVVLTFPTCGECSNCVSGVIAYCERRSDLVHGRDRLGRSSPLSGVGGEIGAGFFGQSSFATYAMSRPRNTVVVPDDIDVSLAAPLGCSTLTGVGTVLNTLELSRGDSAVVFGVGAVGLSAIMGARIAGCRAIVAVDPVASRRALAADLGATATIDPNVDAVTQAVKDSTSGGATAAIDTTARPDVLANALTVLRPLGKLAVLGLGAPTAELPVAHIMRNGLTVRGVIQGDCNPHEFIPFLVQRWQQGELPLEKLVTRYNFEQFGTAWSDAKAGRSVKPVLVTPPATSRSGTPT